jgi:membrane-associated phospholipid phosphatase
VNRGSYLGAALSGLLDIFLAWDDAAMALSESLRWEPLTVLFLVASAWWVKWPLFAVVGACGDATCRRRRRLPTGAIAAGAAAAAAGLAVTALKETFDRARPPVADPTVSAVGTVPDSASFPSGHSATAFAAAVAVGMLYPRLRWPLLALAALVAASRVYLGVHYVTDVAAGTVLGIAVGVATAWVVRRREARTT